MGTLTPTTSERVVSAFRAFLSSPAYRWDELRSFFLLAVRSERDAGLEVGTLVARRIDREIVRIQELATSIAKLEAILPQATVDENNVRQLSETLRSSRRLSSPQVLAALEQDLRRAAGIAVRNGDAINDAAEGLAAADRLLESWSTLTAAVAGAKQLVAALGRLPPIDMIYLLNRIADWMQNASREPDPGKRRDVSDAILSALVYVRLLQRSAAPDLYLTSVIGDPRGVCDPARRSGANSGPFRVVSGSCRLRCSTQFGSEDLVARNLPETEHDLPTSATDGWHYFAGVQPGSYTCRVAGAVWPGVEITLTTTVVQGGSRITPEDVRDVINKAAISGLSASVTNHLDGSKNVHLSCTLPVSGPSGWFRFYKFSGSWMETFFPGTVLTGQVTHAPQLVRELGLGARCVRLETEHHVLFSGDLAYPSAGDPNRVYIRKADGTCVIEGNKVKTTSGPHLQARAGDECILMPGPVVHVVEQVLPDGLVVSGSPDLQSFNYSVSHTLDPAVPGAGMSLRLDGGWYRFTVKDWQLDVSGFRYIDLGDRTPPDPMVAGPRQCSVFQEVLHVDSAGETTDSWLQIVNWNDVLNAEIGIPGSKAYVSAYEWRTDVTAVEGFRSRVLPGDRLFAGLEVFHDVAEVHDGYVVLTEAAGIQKMSGAKFVNATRQAWDLLIASLVLPDFDPNHFSALVAQQRGSPSPATALELAVMSSSLATSLSQLLAPVRAYTGRRSRAPVMKAMLLSLRRTGLDVVVGRLERGDLAVVLEPVRKTNQTAETSDRSGELARSLHLDLTVVERIMLGAGD